MLDKSLDIISWLHVDAGTTNSGDRHARDRHIGRGLSVNDEVSRILAWWLEIGSPSSTSAGSRLLQQRRLVSIGLGCLGMLLGFVLALAAFAYDGRHPVNLVPLIGVLVVAPLVMLVGSLLLMPSRLPGFAWLQSALRSLNVGQWTAGVVAHFSQDQDPGWRYCSAPVLARLSRWQFLYWSQQFACAYFLAVMATALSLVTFSDLAFGWSTTLNISPAPVADFLQTIAAPWGQWFPQAVPSTDLVTVSQFFRLHHSSTPTDVARLGEWWPFIIMMLLCYGLLPRVIVLFFCRWRLTSAERILLLTDVEVRRLLDRMNAPLLQPGQGDDPQEDTPDFHVQVPVSLVSVKGSVSILNWNAALEVEEAGQWCSSHLGLAQIPLNVVGDQAPKQLAEQVVGDLKLPVDRVVVLTKAWEPPLLEVLDFLKELKQRLPKGCTILVLPLGIDGRSADPQDLSVWTARIEYLADPQIYVVETGHSNPGANPSAPKDGAG